MKNSYPRDFQFVFPRLASTDYMTPIGAKIANSLWRLEFWRPGTALDSWWRRQTMWPHIEINLWNGRVAQANTRIMIIINGYDNDGRIRWFYYRPKVKRLRQRERGTTPV